MGVKFGMEEGTEGPLLHANGGGDRRSPPPCQWRRGPKVPSSMPNFTPIGATCRPCGAKNLKIGL